MAIYTTALMSGQMVGPAIGGALGDARRLAGGDLASRRRSGSIVARRLRADLGPGRAPAADRRRRRRRAPGGRRRAIGAGARERSSCCALAAVPFATFFGIAGLTQTLIPLIGSAELGFSASAIGLRDRRSGGRSLRQRLGTRGSRSDRLVAQGR